MKIAPGLRVNLTHRGVSARIGPKGAGYTVNANGRQHISAGIPGSGIHVSEQISPPRKRRKIEWDEPAPVDHPSSTAAEKALMVIGAAAVIGGLIWFFG